MARICDQVVPHSQDKEGQEVCLCFQPTDGPAADFRAPDPGWSLPLVDHHLAGFRDLLRRSLMPCGWHCQVSGTRNGASMQACSSSELRKAVSTGFVRLVVPQSMSSVTVTAWKLCDRGTNFLGRQVPLSLPPQISWVTESTTKTRSPRSSETGESSAAALDEQSRRYVGQDDSLNLCG